MSSTVIRSDLENLYDPEVDYETNLQDELETFMVEGNENDWDSGSTDLLDGMCEEILPFPNAGEQLDDGNIQPIDFVSVEATNDQLSRFEIEDESKIPQEIVGSGNQSTETYYNALRHINNKNNSECRFRRPVNIYDLDVHTDIALLSRFPNKDILLLSAEEEEVINNCRNPKLKRLLVLNRLKRLQIEKSYTENFKTFHACCEVIRKESIRLSDKIQFLKMNRELNSMSQTYAWRLGAPYFKTKRFFGARPNADAERKIKNREYLISNNFSGMKKWSPEDQIALHLAVVRNYFSNREDKLEKTIKHLKLKIAADEQAKEELKFVELRLTTLRQEGANELPPLNCSEEIDWHFIAVHDLKGKHLYLQCKAFWNIYLHPSINKTDWTVEENEIIKDLAHKHNYQNWDLIAAELKTNRSGYLVAVHFNTKLCDKFRRQRFLPEEDEFLMDVVKKCRVGVYIPWGRVSGYFSDRSKHQLYHRYRYYLECKDIKKGTFTEAEDILLAHLAEVMGKDFSRISKLIPHRTSIQLRNRYSNYLENLQMNLGNYTYADDERILNYVSAFGEQSWSGLSKQLKRTRAHVRQRYLTLKKWLSRYPDCALGDVPRRRQHTLCRTQTVRHQRMIEVLEQLRSFEGGIPTLKTIQTYLMRIDRKMDDDETKWRVKKTSTKTRSILDKKLLNFFKGTCKFSRDANAMQEDFQVGSALRVAKCLDVIGYSGGLIQEETFKRNPNVFGTEPGSLQCLNKMLAENCEIKEEPLENPEAATTLPDTSESLDPLSLHIPKTQVKNLIPPVSTTLLGIRGMIIKSQQFKEASKFLVAPIKVNSDRPTPATEIDWKLEHSLLQFDVYSQTKIRLERAAFFRRFYALYKWASLLSQNFPQQLKVSVEIEDEEIIEEQHEPRKVGRPIKKIYDKVMKMVEARKRPPEDPAVYKAVDTQAPRPKRPKVTHAVGYMPRRSQVKTDKSKRPQILWDVGQAEGSNVDDPSADDSIIVDSNLVEVVLDDSASANAETQSLQKLRKVSYLELPTGIPVVNKDKLNALMKNTNKIVFMQNAPVVITSTQNLEPEPQPQQSPSEDTTPKLTSDVCEAEALATNKQSIKPRRKPTKPTQKLPAKIVRRNRLKARQLAAQDGLNRQPVPNMFSIKRNLLNKNCRKWKRIAAKKSGKHVLKVILRDLSLMESQSRSVQNTNCTSGSSQNKNTKKLDAVEVKHEVMIEETFVESFPVDDSYSNEENKLVLKEMLEAAAAVEARQVQSYDKGHSLPKLDWDKIEERTKNFRKKRISFPRNVSSTETLDFPVKDFRSGFSNNEEHRKYLQEVLQTAAAVEARAPVVAQDNVQSKTDSVTAVRTLPSRKTKIMKSYKHFK